MCYTPLGTAFGQLDRDNDIYILPAHRIPVPDDLKGNTAPMRTVTKRKTDTTLEHELTKKPKAGSEEGYEDDDSDASNHGLSEVEESSETEEASEAEVLRTGRTLRSMVAVPRTGKTNSRLSKVQKIAPKASPNSQTPGGAGNHTIEEFIRRKYDIKLQSLKDQQDIKVKDLKAAYQAKLDMKHANYQAKVESLKSAHAGALKAKDEQCKNKLNEWRMKAHGLVKAAKNREQEAKDHLAEEKKRFAEDKKLLKAEQVAEINKWKPSFSPLLKKRAQTIEALTADKVALQGMVDKHKKNVEFCEHEISRLGSEKDVLEEERDNIRAELSGKVEDIAILLNTEKEVQEQVDVRLEAETVAWQERLKLEGERWQKQYHRGEVLSGKLVQLQRANFDFRNMAASRDCRIRALSTKICELEAKLSAFEGEADGSKSRAAIHEMAIEPRLVTVGTQKGEPENIETAGSVSEVKAITTTSSIAEAEADSAPTACSAGEQSTQVTAEEDMKVVSTESEQDTGMGRDFENAETVGQ